MNMTVTVHLFGEEVNLKRIKKTPQLSFKVKRVYKSHQKKVQELKKIVLTEN